MLFESLQNWKVYNGQSEITFPKTNKTTKKVGFGNAVFLIAPNLDKSEEVLKDSVIKLSKSYYKKYTLDTIYKEKIGTKKIIQNKTGDFNKRFKNRDLSGLSYVNRATLKTVTNSKKNIVVDLSNWMELWFLYRRKASAKMMCEGFLEFFANRLSDSTYEGYDKIILLDITSWTAKASSCVVMSKKLLINPLAILMYSTYYFPELIQKYFKGYRLYFVNRLSQQVFLCNSEELTKENYMKLRTKLKQFKGIEFSAEEEDNESEMSSNEIQANIVEDFRKDVIKRMKGNLTGESTDEFNNEEDVYDITKDFDEENDELDMTDETTEDESEDEIVSAELIAELDRMLKEEPDIANEIDPGAIAKKIISEKANKAYIAPFAPVRTPEQQEKVDLLLEGQNTIIRKRSTAENIESQKIDTTDYSNIIDTTNVNILQSKFVNFDKNYNEKNYNQDIDNAVACLSNATDKIFIVGKEEIDTSDTMNLKKTMIYRLQDEKGNKMTLRFDLPIIIDNNYVFINGSKKVIGHQFVLKPLVKTGPDTVQLVTYYNKVFITRDGAVDANTNAIKIYIDKNKVDFKVQPGNTSMKNGKYNTSVDFMMYCKEFYQFKIKEYLFITEIDKLIEKFQKDNPGKKVPSLNGKFPCAYNTKTKELVILKSTDSVSEFITSILPEGILDEIKKIKRRPRLVYARAKIMKKYVPVILFLLYWEGFESVMHKANIDYKFIDKSAFRKIDKFTYDYIELADGILYWPKNPMKNSLLMNGLHKCDFSTYTFEELESKDTYRDMMRIFYGDDTKSYALDQYKDFMIDEVSKEILIDMGYPTDLVSLFILAVSMLCDNSYLPENNMENMRIRSNEVIANITYKVIADAYNDYRRTSYKKKPSTLKIKQSKIIDILLSEKTNLLEESSVLNPVLEIEKARAVTFKGMRGIQLDRAMTLQRRGYDESMLGVIGISTPPDANCGIVRQMTLEPMITSTRGYIDVKNKAGVDELTDANLLTPAELLTPMGVIHDDPDRTAISVGNSRVFEACRSIIHRELRETSLILNY